MRAIGVLRFDFGNRLFPFTHSERRPHLKLILTRRRLFALGGGAALACFLPGCGGGDDAVSVGTAAGTGRTVVSGDLKAQIELFSGSVEQLGGGFQGSSVALDSLRDFTGRVSRAPSDFKVVVQALGIGLNGSRAAYERLVNVALMMDDLGSVAQTVTSNNNLSGSNAVNNPQWLAGMMLQNFASIRVTAALHKIQLVAGLQELKVWALAQPNPQSQLVCYGFVADIFNSWVDAVADVTGLAAPATQKLDVSSSVTASNIADQFAKIPAILLRMPFSPGYRPAGATLAKTDDASLGATGVANFAPSLTGVLSRSLLSSTPLADDFFQTIDVTKAKYDVSARLGSTGVGQTLAGLSGGLPAAQTILNTLLASTTSSDWPGLSGAAAQCQFQMIGKIYGFLQSLITAIVTTQSVAGTIISGNQALQNLKDIDDTIAQCGSAYQKTLWALSKTELKVLSDFHFDNGAVPTTRQVSAVSVAGLHEFDQLSKLGIVCNTEVKVPSTDEITGTGAGGAVCIIDPKKPDVPVCRELIAGFKKNPNCPRTFNRIEICLSSLIFDLTVRNIDTLNGKFTDDTLTFCYSQFSRLYSREPGLNFIVIPAISQASLLCSGVGYIPSRSVSPVDLATLPSMPNLSQITNLVGGVPVNVK